MTSISHALIGVSLAATINKPELLIPVALTTHLLCDCIPHWDLGTSWRLRPKLITGTLAILETLFALSIPFWLFSTNISPLLLAIGIVFSLLPDWLEIPYYLTLPNAPRPFYYIYKIQSIIHSRLKAPWGIYTQIVTVGAFLLIGFWGKI